MTDNPYSGKDPQQYIAALDALVGQQSPLEILAAQTGRLRDFFDGLDEAKCNLPEAAGKWSIVDVLHHLYDVELVYGYRVRQIAASHTPPVFPDMDQDLWAAAHWYRAISVTHVLAALAAAREVNLAMLHSLSAVQRARFGIHSKRGQESVDILLVRWAGHDLVHLRQLKRIREAVR